MAFEDATLFSASVRDNVLLGREESTEQELEEAIKVAQAQFVYELPEGLDTKIGEEGLSLSGGQRQRLGIARALYTRPKLLVLDEATSALDAETERAIIATLQELEGDVTTVTVAHRLATVRYVDQLIYLEHGRVVARGSFDELRSQVPEFELQATILGL
jgi:ATP-binding cassette subfamily B protein